MNLIGLLVILLLIATGFYFVAKYMPGDPPFMRWIGFGFLFIVLFMVIWQVCVGNVSVPTVRLR